MKHVYPAIEKKITGEIMSQVLNNEEINRKIAFSKTMRGVVYNAPKQIKLKRLSRELRGTLYVKKDKFNEGSKSNTNSNHSPVDTYRISRASSHLKNGATISQFNRFQPYLLD